MAMYGSARSMLPSLVPCTQPPPWMKMTVGVGGPGCAGVAPALRRA